MNRPLPPSTDVSLSRAAQAAADFAFAHAASHDHEGAFPEREVAELHRLGLLAAPFDGALGVRELAGMLRRIGAGSLPLGRLFEGHVNALGLIQRYGDAGQIARAARETRDGQLFGVWASDDANGLKLVREGGKLRLQGRKILASGAGFIARPLVPAYDEEGRRWIVTPWVGYGQRADLSAWTAQGMRASATGAVDFSGIVLEPEDVVGAEGDYERQPYFSGGAWRFCAVQQGGMEKLFELLRAHLRKTGRGGDPHQAARVGEAGIAVETARLWVESAARRAEAGGDAEEITAYVNLARLAVERAGLDLITLAQRSIGLQGFMRPNPFERVARDLATYLRQPAPDRALAGAAAFMLSREEGAVDLWG